uniref:Conotoxin Bt6.2 n=1 Tax=Conus betulinus TaxID=89764 RepID=M9PNF7_CONBE|nr:conotoxin Bt6.2 [Conus betulinus]
MSKLGVVLFLTACQLITPDSSRDKQEDPVVRSSDKVQRSKHRKLAKRCSEVGAACDTESNICCSGECFAVQGSTFGICE